MILDHIRIFPMIDLDAPESIKICHPIGKPLWEKIFLEFLYLSRTMPAFGG